MKEREREREREREEPGEGKNSVATLITALMVSIQFRLNKDSREKIK